MRAEPQEIAYTPDPQIRDLADWLGDGVFAAGFPRRILRWRNQRWAGAVGLSGLDEAAWLEHFAAFAPLADNLPQPLALRYHGHQFGVYNPELGDGRGFLFAQLRDSAGRLLDLGTKGSGQTPWSRAGDGRLTLKGGVRELLATEMLEALGANTSKTFSLVETGEELWRGDEPSPTRSAVLVRLSHGHIRFGSFQRLAALGEHEHLATLVDYCLARYPGPASPDAPPPVQLLEQAVERMADLAASYAAAGFVHGVLNTDNMNISGESCDYGPWRWLPRWDAGFTAAYFDEAGRYCFGRQAEAIRWNLGQLAIALRPLVEAPPLIAAMEQFEGRYHHHLARRVLWRLGVEPRDAGADQALLGAVGAALQACEQSPDAWFFAQRGGRAASGTLAEALRPYAPLPGALDHPLWHADTPPSLVIDEVERVWQAIAEADDWGPLEQQVQAIRALGQALGPPPPPAGQPSEAL